MVSDMGEAVKEAPLYEPGAAKRKALRQVAEKAALAVELRSKGYNFFNGRSLVDYVDDSVKRFNGYVPPRSDLALDWQSRIFTNFTRNIVLAFLSKVALTRPKARFVATDADGFADVKRAHVLSKGVEYTKRRENGDYKFLLAAFECYLKGTVVAYEGYKKVKRKVREIRKYDQLTGDVSFREKEVTDFDDCYQEVIPLEDFLVGNFWCNDVQEQPFVVWRQSKRHDLAEEEFRKYPDWKYVKPGEISELGLSLPYYKDRHSTDLGEKNVEILRFYDRLKDQYRIVANGVLLYDGPIPFHHKKYPFAHGVNELFATDFFYGKSGPDKFAAEQDTMNTFLNMAVDQTYASIYKPILTQDPDYIEEYVMQPNKMFPVNSIDDYKVMNELNGPDASFFGMFQLVQKMAIDSTGGVLGGGVAQSPRGGKVSAKQAMMADESARMNLGLPMKMLEKFEVDALRLRAANFLQFYAVAPKSEAVTGEKSLGNLFRSLKVDDTELSDGKYGTAMLRIAPSQEDLPSPEDLAAEEEVAAMQGRDLEIHVVTPDYVRSLDFDVQVVGESSYQQSKSLEMAMGDEFYKSALMNPLVNQQENVREWVKLYGKDPERFVSQAQPPVPGMEGAPPGLPSPQGQTVTQQVAGVGQEKSFAKLMEG